MTGDVDIAAWLAERPMVPEMDVAAFVADARGLGPESFGLLHRALREGDATTAATALGALRARGIDVFRPGQHSIKMRVHDQPGDPRLKDRIRPPWTFEGLAAPMSDRPNEAMRPSYRMRFEDLVRGFGYFRRSHQKARDEYRRKRAATASLAVRGTGLPTDQVDDLIDQIWVEHGLPAPPAYAHPVLARWTLGPGRRLSKLRAAVLLVEAGARSIAFLIRALRHQERIDKYLPGPTETLLVPGRDSIEVTVDVDAQHRLAAMSKTAAIPTRTITSTFVHLRRGDGNTVEVWERTSDTAAPVGRLGLIPAASSGPYLTAMETAEREGQSVACIAIRVTASRKRWRLYLYVPKDSGTEIARVTGAAPSPER